MCRFYTYINWGDCMQEVEVVLFHNRTNPFKKQIHASSTAGFRLISWCGHAEFDIAYSQLFFACFLKVSGPAELTKLQVEAQPVEPARDKKKIT
jgi:hypothetical protein